MNIGAAYEKLRSPGAANRLETRVQELRAFFPCGTVFISINLKRAFINIFYREPHEFRDAQSGHICYIFWVTGVVKEIENQ
jgi:hypothetical protein